MPRNQLKSDEYQRTFTEIGRIMGCTPAHAQYLHNKAIRKLRDELLKDPYIKEYLGGKEVTWNNDGNECMD